MKGLLVALLVFCAVGEIGLTEESSKDPYSERLVSAVASRTAPLISMQEKAINRLGDAAAIGLIRHVGVQVPSTPQEIEGILLVVRMPLALLRLSPQTPNRFRKPFQSIHAGDENILSRAKSYASAPVMANSPHRVG